MEGLYGDLSQVGVLLSILLASAIAFAKAIRSLSSANKDLAEQVATASKEIAELAEEVHKLKEKRDELEERVRHLLDENAKLEADIMEMRKLNLVLEQKVEDLSVRLSEMTLRNKRLWRGVTTLIEQISELGHEPRWHPTDDDATWLG